MADGFAVVVAWLIMILSFVHIVVAASKLRILQLAWQALRPAPDILPGKCCYKTQDPEIGLPDEIYCKHPLIHSKIEDPITCETCAKRVLPYEGHKYLEQVHLDDIQIATLQQALSIVVGLLAIWLTFKNLLK
jgi:hypothetical protein